MSLDEIAQSEEKIKYERRKFVVTGNEIVDLRNP